jgi:hypothetical protein
VRITDQQINYIESDRSLRPSHENPGDGRLRAYIEIVRAQYTGISAARWWEMPSVSRIMAHLYGCGIERYRTRMPVMNKKSMQRLADV